MSSQACVERAVVYERAAGGVFWPAPMGDTWIIDMRHYLDEQTDDLPDSLPDRVVRLALFFGSIVAWVSDHLPQGDFHTNVTCRRSPGRKKCQGDILAELDAASGHIVWQCPICGDNGLIQGWEETVWNRHGGASAFRATADV